MAKPELGSKRQCQHCGAKFFDLNKDPILCPKCGTVFHVTAMTRAAPRAAEAESDAENAPVELVSLEDADAGAEKVLATTEDEVEIEDDDTAADETFLEEEEEGDTDDVAGLIDGDIEEDEEP